MSKQAVTFDMCAAFHCNKEQEEMIGSHVWRTLAGHFVYSGMIGKLQEEVVVLFQHLLSVVFGNRVTLEECNVILLDRLVEKSLSPWSTCSINSLNWFLPLSRWLLISSAALGWTICLVSSVSRSAEIFLKRITQILHPYGQFLVFEVLHHNIWCW